MQIVAIFQQLLGKCRAPHAKRLPLHALLFQLCAQQLRLLLRLAATALGFTQLTVGIFQCQTRLLELFFDAHTAIKQLFQFHAQLFQRCGALLQIEIQLLAALDGALELHLQPLQRLARRVVLSA